MSNHLAELSKNIDLYLTNYDQLPFFFSFNLTSMINKPTCFKNPDQPSCIDLILTNCPRSFKTLVLQRQVYQIFIN